VKALRSVDPLAPSFVLLWTSGYVGGSIATRHAPPFTITLWRFVLSAVVLTMLAWWRQESWPRTPRALALTSAAGVVMYAVQFCALYEGLAEGMPAATTALIACSAPLLVAVAGAALRWDRLTGLQWLGIMLGVAGVATTVSDRLGRPPSVQALLWTLLGLAGLAAGSLMQTRLVGLGDATALTAVQVGAGVVVTAVVAPLAGPLTIPATLPAWGSFLWLALVTGIGGPLLLFALIARRGPTQGTTLLFLVPGTTALAAWPLLGEAVGPVAVVGLAVAALGLWLGRSRPEARPRPGAPERHEPLAVGVLGAPAASGCT
jgi:drug/metabolite transporter (DMT)-like permease